MQMQWMGLNGLSHQETGSNFWSSASHFPVSPLSSSPHSPPSILHTYLETAHTSASHPSSHLNITPTATSLHYLGKELRGTQGPTVLLCLIHLYHTELLPPGWSNKGETTMLSSIDKMHTGMLPLTQCY